MTAAALGRQHGGWLEDLARADPRLRNACRLLQDAELLRRHRRYPSAAALAVLSLEEIGKFWQTSALNRDAVPTNRADRSHGHKQAAAADVLWGTLNIDQAERFAGRFGYKLGIRRRGQPGPRGKTIGEFLADVRASNSPSSADPIVALLRGEFDRLKQACFYVDPTPEGWSEPVDAVDRKLADSVISLVRKALYGIHQRRARFLRMTANEKRPATER